MPRQTPKLLLACALFSTIGGAFAQDIVAPRADLPLRDSPPGLFQSKGDQIGTVSADQDLRVIEQRTVPTITGSENWIKVAPMEGDGARGWIYSGPSRSPDANVAPKMDR